MNVHHHIGQNSYNFPNLSNTFYTKNPKIKSSYDMTDSLLKSREKNITHSK